MMTFSIILPVYNVEPYIEDCLKSIENQSFSDYELIVVMDETSEDDSETIVKSFAKEYNNIKVVYQGHHGLGAARNYGMKYAVGEYLIFLDSDDTFGNNGYLKDIANVVQAKEPDYVITRSAKYVGKTGGEVGNSWGSKIIDNPIPKKALIEVLNSGYFGISAWGKAIKREFCNKHALEFADGYSEDYDWTSRIINLTEKFAFVDTPGVAHYLRPGSLSGDHNFKQVNDLGKRIENWLKLVPGKSEFEKAQLSYLAYSYYIYIADIHFVCKSEQYELWEREKRIRYLRKYGVSKKCKYCNFVCNMLGTKLGSFVLFQYVKRKRSV